MSGSLLHFLCRFERIGVFLTTFMYNIRPNSLWIKSYRFYRLGNSVLEIRYIESYLKVGSYHTYLLYDFQYRALHDLYGVILGSAFQVFFLMKFIGTSKFVLFIAVLSIGVGLPRPNAFTIIMYFYSIIITMLCNNYYSNYNCITFLLFLQLFANIIIIYNIIILLARKFSSCVKL
jgi:hypothetical protein